MTDYAAEAARRAQEEQARRDIEENNRRAREAFQAQLQARAMQDSDRQQAMSQTDVVEQIAEQARQQAEAARAVAEASIDRAGIRDQVQYVPPARRSRIHAPATTCASRTARTRSAPGLKSRRLSAQTS